jgi:hypothetical protein
MFVATLFAASSGEDHTLVWLLFFLLVAGVLGFQVWLAVARPEIYAQKQKQDHERKMRNRAIAGRIAKPLGSILGAAIKKKLGG